LRQAREKLVEDLGESDLTWASYVLYGDPTTVYLPLQEGTPTRGEFRIQTVTPAPSKKGWIVTAAILAAIVLVLGTLFLQRLASRPDKLNPLVGMVEGGQFSQALVQAQDLAGGKDRQALYLIAVAYHENGNAQAAAEYREKLKALSPDDPGFKILSAEDAMTAGDAEGAKNLLSAALAEPKLWPWQKARALNLRGRIAENEGQAGDARGFYQQALAAEPNSFATLVNLALLAENQGDFQEASSLFARARKLRPNDQMLASIEKDGEDRAAYRQDPANVERVQSLIKELGNITPAAPAANPDLWTSKPLVVAVMGMKSSGGILARGGQAEYLLIKLNEFFQQTPLPVVERKELETLLAEMKLSQTNLADQETAVRIGRLLAARYLVTGDLTYLGNEVEVGLRVVETETGLVTASFSESFDTRKDYLPAVREFVNRIASETVAKLPPRGRVVSVEGDLVVLNIGAKAGVRAGDKFNAFLEAEVKPLMKGDRIAAYLEPSTAAAILEVTAVEPELSRAKVITQTAPPAAGMLVSRQRALP
jgi:tetratricopeptide (TPR) repeat protein